MHTSVAYGLIIHDVYVKVMNKAERIFKQSIKHKPNPDTSEISGLVLFLFISADGAVAASVFVEVML